FGFAERVAREAYWVNETCFWRPAAEAPGHIARARVIQDVEDGLSEFPHVILNQARVHDHFLDILAHAASPVTPDYARRLIDLRRDDHPSHPLVAVLEPSDPRLPQAPHALRARYVVGCDGARSAVRGALGLALEGDAANQAWGVMDVLAVTDFPDVRRKTVIQSAREGSMLIIPREGGYLVRFYIELDKLAPDQRVSALQVSPEHLIAAARRILAPYTLEVKEVAWWSVYEIGQRLCARFDDGLDPRGGAREPRVFIAGDACHTHSPKAGQGMNVSMQDAFNLGWKLGAVLAGRAAPAVLDTYSLERQAVAAELIDFDRRFAALFSARPAGDGGAVPAEFQEYFVRQGRFTAGTATCYPRALLIGPRTHQALASGLPVGMRFHSAPVLRLADAKPMHLGHVLRADGRWRLFLFAPRDDCAAPGSRLRSLLDFLAESGGSPLRRHRRADEDIDALIEVLTVFQVSHHALSLHDLPPLLKPRKGRYGLVDYEKVYCPSPRLGEDVFTLRGIDREQGCMVLVRPDQYVAQVLPLEGGAALANFLAACLLEGTDPGRGLSQQVADA
ncbi:MAG: FAD-dependent monooxygenase, partial [Gammaproteobacteria bacterium]